MSVPALASDSNTGDGASPIGILNIAHSVECISRATYPYDLMTRRRPVMGLLLVNVRMDIGTLDADLDKLHNNGRNED